VGIPVDDFDAARLDEIEQKVLTPKALAYLVTKAEDAIRQSLAQDPEQIDGLRRRRADTERKITRLVEAIAEGQPPKSILTQITDFERDLKQMDKEIEGLEARALLGQLDVARALRALEPPPRRLAGYPAGESRPGPADPSQTDCGADCDEPLPEVHGYKWKGQLNGGAVLEGTQRYRWCRGPGPIGIITWKHELLIVPFAGEWAA